MELGGSHRVRDPLKGVMGTKDLGLRVKGDLVSRRIMGITGVTFSTGIISKLNRNSNKTAYRDFGVWGTSPKEVLYRAVISRGGLTLHLQNRLCCFVSLAKIPQFIQHTLETLNPEA